jgi:hypothetical protein
MEQAAQAADAAAAAAARAQRAAALLAGAAAPPAASAAAGSCHGDQQLLAAVLLLLLLLPLCCTGHCHLKRQRLAGTAAVALWAKVLLLLPHQMLGRLARQERQPQLLQPLLLMRHLKADSGLLRQGVRLLFQQQQDLPALQSS